MTMEKYPIQNKTPLELIAMQISLLFTERCKAIFKSSP